MREPVDRGPFSGFRCEQDKWDEMLDRFYDLQGWDRATGLQTRSGLQALGLDDVASRLEAAGKLIEQ
jgi:aldehyde:ferredoxin oxidoreductase